MATFKNIEAALDKFAFDTVKLMQQELQGTQLAQNIKVVPEGVFSAAVIMPEYGVFVDSGRGPGKRPPISELEHWAAARGIPEKALFPIAKKIGEEGTKPKPFLFHLEDEDRLIEALEEALGEDIFDNLGI